jgi:hypothetical protein
MSRIKTTTDDTDDADVGFPDLTGGTIPEIRGIRGLVIRANPWRPRMSRIKTTTDDTDDADYGVPDLTGGTIPEVRGIRGFGDPREIRGRPRRSRIKTTTDDHG